MPSFMWNSEIEKKGNSNAFMHTKGVVAVSMTSDIGTNVVKVDH